MNKNRYKAHQNEKKSEWNSEECYWALAQHIRYDCSVSVSWPFRVSFYFLMSFNFYLFNEHLLFNFLYFHLKIYFPSGFREGYGRIWITEITSSSIKNWMQQEKTAKKELQTNKVHWNIKLTEYRVLRQKIRWMWVISRMVEMKLMREMQINRYWIWNLSGRAGFHIVFPNFRLNLFLLWMLIRIYHSPSKWNQWTLDE